MIARISAIIGVGLLATLAAGAAWAGPKYPVTPLVAVPTGPPDASFYELTETMQLLAKRGRQARVATSALGGYAKVGTPFCPAELAYAVMAAPISCSLVAIGKDNVSLQDGLGTFQANLEIVVQGDNPVDGPEFAVAEMKVLGKMDFSPAILGGLPYGTVTGVLAGSSVPRPRPAFIGVFRLPFIRSAATAALCGDSGPNPNFPVDYVYVSTTPTGEPTGCIDILPEELALGVPTVRFDIWFTE